MEIYVENETYAELVATLAALGRVEEHEIVEALAEIGNVWPAYVLDDPDREA